MFRTLPRLVRASSFAVLEAKRSKFGSSPYLQYFSLESSGDLKDHFVERIEDYLCQYGPLSRPRAELEEEEEFHRALGEWAFDNTSGMCCFYETESPVDVHVPLHVLLETVEAFKDDHGDRYKLETASNIGSGITRYIFAKESKPDHN